MEKEKWTVYGKRADFFAIAEKFGIDPVIARVIRNRDVVGDEAIEEYLYGGMECLNDPFLLKDMDLAVQILKTKISEQARIRIMGDYDIDGIMSSYILKRGFAELGGIADVRIPNRMTDGYGLSMDMIQEAIEDGIDTIVTCDNGISAWDSVRAAKEAGMTVVVTDHHEVLELPCADACVDPKREDDTSPNKNLCGGAVAWKLIRALGGDPGFDMLQYAAFATIGDIVELKGENRIIVKEGLRRLRNTDNVGLNKLAEVCKIDIRTLGTYHIGYVLGPCLNATGRLDTAMRAIRLLSSSDPAEALKYAEELHGLNESRKALTEQGTEEAIRICSTGAMENDRVLVIFLPDVHESIAGIIAGRIRERMNKPTIILTRGEQSVKGSGRSIENYSMFEELVKVKHLLIKFGGHPMAAGLSLKEENIDALRLLLNENCTLSDEDLIPRVRIDVPMPLEYVTEELIDQLELLEPFGKGNEKPVFAQKKVWIDRTRTLGQKEDYLKMRIRPLGDGESRPGIGAREFEGITFRNGKELMERAAARPEVMIAYEPSVNEYMGNRKIQIRITHFQ